MWGLAAPDIAGVLGPAQIARAFDLDEQFKHIDEIFDRVFPDASRRGNAGIAEAVGSVPA